MVTKARQGGRLCWCVVTSHTIGGYRVLWPIGEGATGRVLLGLEVATGRHVALKQLHRHLMDDQTALERFEAEAEVGRRLDHPNVARVHELVVDGGVPFLVMEWVRGRNLRQLLGTAGVLHPALATFIVTQLAAGLAHAHAAGVVHRDVTPENVLLSHEGEVKLTDFGVHRARVGKAGYVAPECVDGGELTPSSDVFSAAVVLLECTGGSTARVAPLHPKLEGVLTRALAPLSARFPTAAPLHQVLAEAARVPDLYATAESLAALMRGLFDDGETPTGWLRETDRLAR